MKTTSWNTMLVGFGAILVLALAGVPTIHAEEQADSVLQELKQIEVQINQLKENTNDFSIHEIGLQSFKFRVTGETILDIQKSNSVETADGKQISKILDYLINDYKEIQEEFIDKVSNYQKHSTLSSSEQLVLNELVKNELNFEISNEKQNKLISQQQFINSEIERLHNESKFQNLITKVGIQLADDYNGNETPKIQHKLALQKIIDEANWELTSAALDRTINQMSDENSKTLIKNKEKILNLIEKLDEVKQQEPTIYTLTSSYADIFFGELLNNENEIHTPYILSSQIKSEIKFLVENSIEIVEEEENKNYEILLAQRADSQEEDEQDSIRKKINDSQSESESEPENNGNGNGNSNGNGNGNSNGNSNGNNGGSDSGSDGDNSNGNGKGKGKKA